MSRNHKDEKEELQEHMLQYFAQSLTLVNFARTPSFSPPFLLRTNELVYDDEALALPTWCMWKEIFSDGAADPCRCAPASSRQQTKVRFYTGGKAVCVT